MYSNYLRFCISFTLITYSASLLCWECSIHDFREDPNCLFNDYTNCSDPFTSATGAPSPELNLTTESALPNTTKSNAKHIRDEDFGKRQHVCYIVFGDVIEYDNGTNIEEAPSDHEEEYLDDLTQTSTAITTSAAKAVRFNIKDCWKLDKFKKLRSGQLVLKNHSVADEIDLERSVILGTGVRRGCYKKTIDVRNDTDVCNCVRYQHSLERPRFLDVKTCIICEQDKCIEPPGIIPVDPPRGGLYSAPATLPTSSLYLVLINFSLLCF